MHITRIALLLLTMGLLGWVCFAQEDAPPEQDPPEQTEAAAPGPEQMPATTPEPAAAEPAPAPASDPAELFDPAVAALLQAQWAATGGSAGGPFTATANATFLSQPSGFDVFMIPVDDVRAAEQGDGNVTVESLVFNDAHFIGQTPLTVSLPARDYVLAVRSTLRAEGFDGECVRQFTRDPITGGRRFDYHLYPLKKDRNNYLCFIANFLSEGFPQESAFALPAGSDSLFAIPQQQLEELLASACQAPEERRARLAQDLLDFGTGFYSLDQQMYLVKLTLNGTESVLKEWPIATEVQ